MRKKLFYTFGTVVGILFIILAIWIKVGYTRSPLFFDRGIQIFLYSFQGNNTIIVLSSFLTSFLGDIGGLIFGCTIALILYFVFKQKRGAIWLLGAEFIGVGIDEVVKKIVGRVRPDTNRVIGYAHDSGASFASGHATFTIILVGVLFLIFLPSMRTKLYQFIFAGLGVLLVILVMASRVILGVHYPSDTIGGVLLGITTICFSYPIYFNLPRRIHN